MIRRLAILSLACAFAPGCSPADAPGPDRDAEILQQLRAFEAEARSSADFARMPPSDRALGPDPYAICGLESGAWIGLLRGASALVLLDERGEETARAPTSRSPSGLDRSGDGTIAVVAETSPSVARYRVKQGKIEPIGELPLAHAEALRDVRFGPAGAIYAVSERGRLWSVRPTAPRAEDRAAPTRTGAPALEDPAPPLVSEVEVPVGSFRLVRSGDLLAVVSAIGHAVRLFHLEPDGSIAAPGVDIANDGPLWATAIFRDGDDVIVASGGVEDHPLVRTNGSFEHIDSYVYVDRVRGDRVGRLHAINVSAWGVVTLQALAFTSSRSLFVTGLGGERAVDLVFGAGIDAPPTIGERAFPPGTKAIATDGSRWLAANPLLDAWIAFDGAAISVAPVSDPDRAERSLRSRVGEALVFTTMMAPFNAANGPLSRFTCETCHFEGAVDGRTHHTGRGDVRATTKPLLGLFNNRPHFSRALDPDLASVAHNEFRVAGARSGHDPVFDLTIAEHPWLAHLGATDADLDAVSLRRSVMAFLMDFTPRANAASLGRAALAVPEARGAEVFRDRCERCHEARIEADVPASRVPFERWPSLVLSEADPIVWGADRYEQTGVVPYVHERGARVPSLRRLARKWPYFTNGSARDLREVLDRVRWTDGSFSHAGGDGQRLTAAEIAPLLAFLRLL